MVQYTFVIIGRTPMNLLIVDDEIYAAQLLHRHLSQLAPDAQLYTANNGLEAKAILETTVIDLAFLDIEMPEISGLELAKYIKEAHSHTVIIFVTAHSGHALEAFRVDAIDYLTKPILKEDVSKALEKAYKFKQPEKPSADLVIAVQCYGFKDLSIRTGTQQDMKWPTLKCKELMAFLCYNSDTAGVSKWKLYDLLWPDKDDSKNDLNLRSTAHRLNKALTSAAVPLRVKSAKNTYSLEGPPLYTDLKHLQTINSSPLSTSPSPDVLLAHINFMEGCYNGEFLEFMDNEWQVDMAAMASRMRLSATEKIISEAFKRNLHLQTQRLLQLPVKAYPYTEPLQLLMIELIRKLQGNIEAQRYQEDIQSQYELELSCEPQWL